METKYNKGIVYFICLASAMGGLLFGYDWVVIGGAKPFYEAQFSIADSTVCQAVAMSIALLGCLVGATTAGALADRIGRKKLLLIAAIIFFFSSLATGMSGAFAVFIVARFIGGVAIGIAADISPMYIAEVAPAEIRGKLVTLNQLTIVIGILLAQVINMLIAEPVADNATVADIAMSWNGMCGWRWMFYAICFPSLLFFVFACFIPESPRWLVRKGRAEQARRALKRIGSQEYVDGQIAQYDNALRSETEPLAGHSCSLLRGRGMKKLLMIGVVIALLQQWCGINVIFNYAQEIFKAAGYGVSDTLMNIVITGIANLVFTFVAIFTVDHLGRKKLVLIGTAGLLLIYCVLSYCYYQQVNGVFMIVLVVCAIGLYAMSLGPIAWVLISEIFPNAVRGVAMAISTGVLWIGSFLLTYTFPFLNKGFGTSGTFLLYAGICLLGFFFTLFQIPETKGKTLEEIEKELINK
jgi:SP family arabinose:H+ symporter-like MFS transporter